MLGLMIGTCSCHLALVLRVFMRLVSCRSSPFRVMELLGVGVVILLASATNWFRDKQIWIFVVMLWALAVFVVQSLILSLGVL
jgi:hypothetical protein